MRKSIIIFLLLLTANAFYAQFTFDFEQLKKKYSRYNTIILEKTEEVTIDIIKDSIAASQHNKELVLILNTHNKQFSNDKIPSSSFTKIRDIDAKTYIPYKKGKYKSLKVIEFTEVDDISDYVFYDDSKSILLTFPALQEGAVTSLEYTIDYLDTRFLSSFIFQSFIPVLKTSLIIKVNKNIELIFKKFHTKNFNFTFSESEDSKYKYYRWKAENLNAYKLGGEKINLLHYSPHIVYYVGKTNVNGLERKHYGTVDDLYRYYFSFTRKVDTSCTQDLAKKVDEIVKGLKNEQEKVKAILNWVRNNIKYIAFEQGMRGFIPDNGSNVYAKKYGDCKDMSSLIVTMLKCAGIKAHIAWTGTRHIPYSYNELPLPKTDNHMVAVYFKDNNPIILDGTITNLTFGYPPYLLQDKEIMVSFDEENYKIYKVPVLSSNKNLKKSDYEIKISGDTILGKGNTSYTGYNRSEILYIISGVKPSDLRKTLMRTLSVGSNKFNLISYKINNPMEDEIPVKINYDFKVPGYVKSVEDEVYINLNINKSYSDYMIDTSMIEIPLENDFCFHEKYITSLEIPDGYTLEYVPENITYQNEKFRFSISYKEKGQRLIQEKNIIFDFLVLEKEKFHEWNEMIAHLIEAYREVVVLKKISNN